MLVAWSNLVCVDIVNAGIAVDGGNGICNGTCEGVPISLVKRQGRVAALCNEIEGCFVMCFFLCVVTF